MQIDIDALGALSKGVSCRLTLGNVNVFINSQSNPCWKYKMEGRILEDVEEEKNLGVVMHKDLKFYRHTTSIIKKANMALGLIRSFYRWILI